MYICNKVLFKNVYSSYSLRSFWGYGGLRLSVVLLGLIGFGNFGNICFMNFVF